MDFRKRLKAKLNWKPKESTVAVTRTTSQVSVGRTSSILSSPGPSDLWQRAEQKLCADDVKGKIYKAYLEILEFQSSVKIEPGVAHRQKSVCELLNAKADTLRDEKSGSRFGAERNVEIRSLFMTISKKVLAAKDIVMSAASASPPAAIACAGTMICLLVGHHLHSI